MRRLIIPILSLAFVASCGDSPLGPVQTVNGTWKGTQSGYALTLAMVQTDTLVSACSVVLGSNGGAVQGTCAGTFKYPNLRVTIMVSGFQNVDYIGTMSTTQAKIFGKLNGSGLENVEVDVLKQ